MNIPLADVDASIRTISGEDRWRGLLFDCPTCRRPDGPACTCGGPRPVPCDEHPAEDFVPRWRR